jgi:DNA-binding NtrC family response regulator
MLADAGIEVDVALETRSIGARPGPGIVVYEQPTQEVAACIHTASRSGSGPVVALETRGAHRRSHEGWTLLDAGASDVIEWDPEGDLGEQLAARFLRWEEVDELLASRAVRDRIVGDSPALTSVLRRLVEVARFTSASVLVTGESGTGKELVARMIHDLDARRDKARFLVLDCTTVVPSLSGSEFFGHDKGAYTGATSPREGAFSLADKGTLFLDEVGDLPLPLQAELLRVIQEGTYKRVGSNLWQRTRFRLVCATNRDLAEEQRQGRFRSDLYFRIAGCQVRLPSLRERTDDIPALVDSFFREFRPDGDPPKLAPGVRSFLMQRDYPGNIRDLKHLVARLSHRHVGPGAVTIGDIPEEERPPPGLRELWGDVPLEGLQTVGLGADVRDIKPTAGSPRSPRARARSAP